METNAVSPSDYEATRALADARSSRSAMAARVVTPVWYHPVLGLGLGLVTWAAAHVGKVPWQVTAVALLVGVIVPLVVAGAYRRMTGVWMGPEELGPRARRIFVVFALVVGGSLLLAVVAGQVLSMPWLVMFLACAVVVATIGLGRRLDATIREEIRDGSAPCRGFTR